MTEEHGHPKDNESLTDQLWRFLNEMVSLPNLNSLGFQSLGPVQNSGPSNPNTRYCRSRYNINLVVDCWILFRFQGAEI